MVSWTPGLPLVLAWLIAQRSEPAVATLSDRLVTLKFAGTTRSSNSSIPSRGLLRIGRVGRVNASSQRDDGRVRAMVSISKTRTGGGKTGRLGGLDVLSCRCRPIAQVIFQD